METGVVFVDDHEIFHECIRHLFNTREDMRMLGVANNGRAAIRLARDLSPDVVVMDISMPGLNGIDATQKIVSENPGIKVIALSMYSDCKVVLQVLKAGAKGYVLKECAFDELIFAIQSVVNNKMYLSPKITGLILEDYINISGEDAGSLSLTSREREVLQLIAEGQSTRRIAENLHVSIKTIETHRSQIMKKLNLNSLPELTKYAIREGLTSLLF
jgi:DNA-binding NarL/FixJ family response regulator